MNERDVQTVYTEDVSSGRVHARLLVNGQLLTDERDNLDDAGEYRTLDSIEGVAPDRLCQRCFPRVDPS